MKTSSTPLAGLLQVDTEPTSDPRGSFERLFCQKDWTPLRANLHFVQINLSTTTRSGTVRGMHFQHPPAAEAKLIRCIRGAAFDVAVDLRAGSPTFLCWHGVELRADVAREVFIPEGFAHGFQSLSDDTQLLYLHTAFWSPDAESGLRHDDPRLAIRWPLAITQLSARDRTHALIDASFSGLSP